MKPKFIFLISLILGARYACAQSAPADTPSEPLPSPKNAVKIRELAVTRETELPEIIVTAKRDSYIAPQAEMTTRSAIPLQQYPQSTQVLTRSLLDNQLQLAQDPGTVVSNFSGVTGFDWREINNAGYIIRGFRSASYLDGIQQYNYANLESLINVERIDLLKGPTGTLFSGATGGPLGGLLNFVSKSPQATPSYLLGVNVNSNGSYGSVWDLNQPLDKGGKILFRLTGDVRDSRDQIDSVRGHLTSLYPSLSIAFSEDTKLTIRARYSDRQSTDYSGLHQTGTVNPYSLNVDRKFFFHAENQPATTARNGSIQVELSHRFDSDWLLTLGGRYQNTNFNQYSVWATGPAGAPFGPAVFGAFNGYLEQEITSLNLSANLNGKFDTGTLAHKLTFGLDFDHTKDPGSLFAGLLGAIDTSNPVYPNWTRPTFPFSLQKNRYQTTALFLQDHITFAERYHLLAATRWNHLGIQNIDSAALLKRDTTYSQFASRLGVAVDLTKALTLFSGWGQGLVAPVGSVITGGIKLISSQQWETGLKVQLGNKLQASVAVFENTRTNEPVSVGLTSVQEGKTRAAGVDSNLIWQPTPEFSALLNYTFQDARVIRGSTTLKAGNQLARVPEHSARAAIRYDFQSGSLKGLGAGFGLTMASRREGDSGNTFSTGGFAVADAQFSYTRGAATYAVGIENLFDSRFFQPHAFLGGTVAPNQPRTAFAQITFRF